MVDPWLGAFALFVFMVIVVSMIIFTGDQLADRREKRYKKWKKEHKAKEKRIEETFAEPDPEPDTGDGKSGESGESDERGSDDLPVQVEAEPAPSVFGGKSVHAPDESCRMCGRSDYSVKMAEIDGMTVCPRKSCFNEAARIAASEASEVLLE